MELNPFFEDCTFDLKKEISEKKIVDKLNLNGIIILKNFCGQTNLQDIQTEFNSVLLETPEWAKIPSKKIGKIIHFSPLVKFLKKDKKHCKTTSKIFKNRFINSLISKYLRKSYILDRIIYTKDEVNQNPITEWHTDHFPTRSKCLKLFLYLSDTDTSNGAFSYIPSIHQYQHTLNKKYNFEGRKKNLYKFEQIKRGLFELSKQFRKKGNTSESNLILKKLNLLTSHINEKEKYDDFFSIPARAGTLIIFDPAGLHKGGIVSKGERYVMRSHFVEFPFKRALRSKNDLYIYIMNKISRFKIFIKKEEILL